MVCTIGEDKNIFAFVSMAIYAAFINQITHDARARVMVTHLKGAAGVIHVFFVTTERTADVRNDFQWRSRYRAPACCKDGGKNQLA